MRVTIFPGCLKGKVRVPASKSAAHRELICAALSDAPTTIKMDGINDDILATARCLRAWGAGVEHIDGGLNVEPIGKEQDASLRYLACGESGSTLRFLLPLAAALDSPSQFSGEGRLPERPNKALMDQLRLHGAQAGADAPPMTVSGPLYPGRYELPGDISSQYASGLLFALPLLEGPSALIFTSNIESAGYLRMTVETLRAYGIEITEMESGYDIPAPQRYVSPGERVVEGDWSAAAFWLTENALGGGIEIDGLNPDSKQGDRAIEEILSFFSRDDNLLEIDARDIPDLVPILAVRAALRPGETCILNAARLRLKESDRLCAMAENLTVLGADIEERTDGLVLRGGKPLTGGAASAHNDHRIAMAMAIAAAHANGPVTIDGAQCVAKSYPNFWRDFEAMGGKIEYGQ